MIAAGVAALLVGRLRERRAAGELTSAGVREAAAGVGVAERTVWGWLAADPTTPARRARARYEITEADRDAYAAWRGNVAAVHRALHIGTQDGPSLRGLQEAFARDLTPGERAAVVDGEEGKRRHQVYLRWAPDRRNALWEADHKELPVLVMAPRAQQPRKPWVTLFVEAYSRLIMGWALSMTPNAGVVLAALRRGIVVDAERGPFGGLPEKLRPDNGLEFVANALGRSCAALGVELAPTPPYKPYAKGKVERRASRRARATLAPITAPGEVDATTISAGQARADESRPERAGRRDEDLRRQAMTTLLDLKTDFAYWNPEVAMTDARETPDPPALDDLPAPTPDDEGPADGAATPDDGASEGEARR